MKKEEQHDPVAFMADQRQLEKSDMDRKTAAKYQHDRRLPSQRVEPRSWRTREDPFVDEWQCVKPSVLGINYWPEIERGTDWKTAVSAELGLDADPGIAWQQLLATVGGYKDLEPSFVGAVEQLIDFCTG